MVDFGSMKDKAQGYAQEHPEQVESGVDQASEQAKERFGHEEQVDQAADKASESLTGGGEEQGNPEESQQ